jgi:1-acyl-sn-glycerol-3-phosphate acyltransferase
MAKRAGVPIAPVAIVGAFECWPRSRRLPRTGRIRLEFGKIITADEVAALEEQELFELCCRRIRELDELGRATRSGIRA